MYEPAQFVYPAFIQQEGMSFVLSINILIQLTLKNLLRKFYWNNNHIITKILTYCWVSSIFLS